MEWVGLERDFLTADGSTALTAGGAEDAKGFLQTSGLETWDQIKKQFSASSATLRFNRVQRRGRCRCRRGLGLTLAIFHFSRMVASILSTTSCLCLK